MMDLNATGDPTDLIPAATIMLLRQGHDGLEVLMLRRNRDLKAFGGAWVFPGGRVDETDGPGLTEFERARHAAIRETSEETGLDISNTKMVALSNWIPPEVEIRRFSTWFFVAETPSDDIQIDQGEIHDYQWVRPRDMVSRIPDREIKIVPPTYVSLHQIMHHETPQQVIGVLNARKPDLFKTRFQKIEKGFATYWEGDAAYDSGDLNCEGPRRRLYASREKWDYVCDVN